MGFSTLIDILGSMVIGGMVLMILLRLNDSAVQNGFQFSGELIVQKNLVEVVELLEYDFRKIGFCKDWNNFPDPSKAIIQANKNSITFLSDVDSDADMDTVRYLLGPTSELSGTSNPRDRMLYRQINYEPLRGANLGVVAFNLTYYDPFGQQISSPVLVPGEIHTMQIDVVLEDVSAYDDQDSTTYDYNRVFWRQIRLAARNLGNR